MRISLLATIVTFFFINGCSNHKMEQPKKYFDLSGLIDEQAILLTASNPTLEKSLFLDKKKEVSKQRDVNWKKELSLFKTFDINLGKTNSEYTVAKETSNGLLVTDYSIADETGVVGFKVFYTADTNLVRIESHRLEENVLFGNFKTVGLNFKQNKIGVTQLVGYCVKGGQKMIAKDSMTYHVDVKVL